jgi:hypothetical protein
MDSWADHLMKQAIENRASILDNTNLSVQEMVEWFGVYISNCSKTNRLALK